MIEEPSPMSDIRGGLFCDEPVCHPEQIPQDMLSVHVKLTQPHPSH